VEAISSLSLAPPPPGSTSCGWSDKVKVTCRKTSYSVEDTLEGLMATGLEGRAKVRGR
jgi:hypothetical protein